jgi:hypothetical protein
MTTTIPKQKKEPLFVQRKPALKFLRQHLSPEERKVLEEFDSSYTKNQKLITELNKDATAANPVFPTTKNLEKKPSFPTNGGIPLSSPNLPHGIFVP